MPFTVQDLIENQPSPLTITLDEPLQKALDLMTSNDYTQLPVVDKLGVLRGIVSGNSILDALMKWRVPIDKLTVKAALITQTKKYRPSDDLFELLDDLSKTYVVLIVNGDGHLVGIVTSFDTTEYFRQQAEDMMLAEDIESALKEHIKFVHSDEKGNIDDNSLNEIIAKVLGNKGNDKDRAKAILAKYLKASSPSLAFNAPLFEETFASTKPHPPTFEKLTLHDYIQLITHPSQWPSYSEIYSIDRDSLHQMLEEVRNIRNSLAHFRDDITPAHREKLRYCANWLNGLQLEAKAPIDQGTAFVPNNDEILSAEDSLTTEDSRYAPLAFALQSQPASYKTVNLTFKEIESIIHDTLPASALRHRAWWANDEQSHVQSQGWLDAGWRVSSVNMSQHHVTFSRTQEREKAYITFFSELLEAVQKAAPFALKEMRVSGSNWHSVYSLNPPGGADINYSFTWSRRFRVELYIDTGNKEKNKQIYDGLHAQKAEIERNLAQELAWERLDQRRASRIVWYHEGSIADSKEALAALREWAVNATIAFQKVITNPAIKLLEAVK